MYLVEYYRDPTDGGRGHREHRRGSHAAGCQTFGFSRVTDKMRQHLSAAVGKTIQAGILTCEGLHLKLADDII
jgi:hypothetical protein